MLAIKPFLLFSLLLFSCENTGKTNKTILLNKNDGGKLFSSIAIDNNGAIFATESLKDSTIYQINPGQSIKQLSRFNLRDRFKKLVISPNGRMYVLQNQYISEVNAKGQVSTLSYRWECDNKAHLILLAIKQHRESSTKFQLDEKKYLYKDGFAENARFSCIENLIVNTKEELYLVDRGNNAIRKIGKNGIVSTFAVGLKSNDFDQIKGFGIDKEGNLFVSSGNMIYKITYQGKVSEFCPGTSSPNNHSHFYYPGTLVVSNDKQIYLSDKREKIFKIDTSTGKVTFIAGGKQGYFNGLGEKAQFNSISNLVIDNNNNLYLLDNLKMIRKVSKNRIVSTIIK